MAEPNAANTMNSVVALETRREARADIMEAVIAKGDLAKLSAEERAAYYLRTCESLGINPLSKPFDYISLNNKLTLYATRTATDQLRTIRGVSLVIVSQETRGDLHVVTVEARTPDGRTDTDIGAVTVAGLKGDALANAHMKAMTKAKRRVTLSMCGLGWLDETEIETIPSARAVVVDTETGEILDAEAPSQTKPATSPTNAPPRAAAAHGHPTPAADQSSRDDGNPPSSGASLNDRDAFRKHFFALAGELGIKHDETVKAFTTYLYPDAGSRANYTGSMWADAVAWLQDEAHADSVAHFRERSWLARIAACPTEVKLSELATELGASGQATDPIRATFRARRDDLQAAARTDAGGTT